MKNIKVTCYSLLLCIMTCTFVSCEKDFEQINQLYKEADVSTVSIAGLFNGLSRSVTSEDPTLNVSLFYPITNQQGAQNIFAPYLNYTSSLWNSYYPMLFNYKALLKKIEEQENPEVFNNVKYMATVLMASKTLHALDYYGDMPYSQASNADQGVASYRPAYDKQEDIYRSVLADLKTAADGLTTAPGQINIGASESFLNNDIQAWTKFANALRLRYAVRLYNVETQMSSEIITDIINNNKLLPNNQDPAHLEKNNFGLWPGLLTALPEGISDRQWYSFRETSVSNMRMSSNVFAQMSSTNDPSGSGIFDPRIYVYFQTNDADQWVPQPQNGSVQDGGSPYGNPTPGTRRPPGTDPTNRFSAFNYFTVYDWIDFPYLIISEADVHFLLAEVFQRGMGVSKDIARAKTEYEAGITSSVNFWYAYAQSSERWLVKPTVPTTAQMTAFLTNPQVLYNGANDADALKKIATQAWLATLYEPAEAWAIVRRTGLTPKDSTYNAPVINKLPYPADESLNNHENWQAETGGADPTAQTQVKVYWMP